MKKIVIISGWAHGIKAIAPIGNNLSSQYDITLISGNDVLNGRSIPDADYIITGSMGGLLAIEHLPEQCQKLILISTSAKFCATEGYNAGTHEKILKRMILQLKRNPESVLAQFYKNVHHPHAPIETDPECALNDLVNGLEYLLQSDVRHLVPNIKIPVLLLHGTKDLIIPYQAAEWLNENLPNAQLSISNDAGHALTAHDFTNIMKQISHFLELQ